MSSSKRIHSIIVGGSKGLGRRLSRLLSSRQHAVTVIGSSASDEDTEGNNFAHEYFQFDVTDDTNLPGNMQNVFARQGAVNNLIFTQRYRGTGDSWEGELHTSVSATRSIIDLCLERFCSPSAIVVVSSVYADFVGDSQSASYHVAKAALEQLVRYYAVALGVQGIRVNGVTPCTFLKDESKHFYETNQPLLDLYQEITPLGRMGTAEEIANVIAFLCSEQSSFVTGQNIVVDGGISLIAQESLARRLRSI